MKRSLSALVLLLAIAIAPAIAQTITPNDSSIVLQAPKKIGINLNGPTYYQGGQIYKNLLWRNPGFEPDLYRDKFVAFTAGTTTTFPSPNQYDPVIANFWTGATFRLYRGTARDVVCSGTLAGNTVAASGKGPTYKFAAPCATPVAAGDVIILRQSIPCTTEAVWEGQGAGWWGEVANGGKLLSECAAPYDGTQSLRLDASISGSSATVKGFTDTNATDLGILLTGQYTLSGFYKTVGSATLSVDARRLGTNAAGNPFACATKTFSASATWTAFTSVCTANETNQLTYSPIAVALTAQGGVVLLDDVSFQKTSGNDPANTTVFRDELITTLKAHCAGASLSAVPCELRDWAFQNADEIDNTIKPIFQRQPTLAGPNYDYPPNGAVGSMSVGLEEFLQLCKAVDSEPYYALPETTGPEDGAKWIEYLNGSPSTPYGAKRAANGQTASWLSVFPTIHLPMGNENWLEGASGQGLGYRAAAPDLYYDYSVDAAGVWAAMRASASWPAGGQGIDLVLGLQNGNADYGVTEAMNRAKPNSAELAPYTQAYVGDTTPLTALWNPLMYEVVANTTNPATIFYQQGTAVKSHGKLNIYEFDNGTTSGSSALNQSVLDTFTDAAGYGTATALQALQHLAFGIVDQNFFSLDQYAFNIPSIGWVHNWGAVIDMGGSTNAVRPQELGMRMANAAIIGPMYACPVTKPDTHTLAANHNGYDSAGTPAASNIPYEYAYCFLSGTQRSMIVINTDVTASHKVSFAGAQAPAGQVVLTRYAPASISAINEGTANNSVIGAAQNVSIDAPLTLTSPTTDTLPPFSITRYDWTSSSAPSAPTATTTTLSSSTLTPATGDPVTLTAAVTPAAATGSVTFQDAGAPIGTGTLTGGTATLTLTTLSVGPHTLTAAYVGDTTNAASASAAISVTVSAPTVAAPAPQKYTATTLSLSSSAPSAGAALTMTASLSSTAVTGTVTFMDASTPICTSALSKGKATCTVASMTPGTHAYMGAYPGNTTYAPSASLTALVTVAAIPTSVKLASSVAAPLAGSSLLLSAAVTSSSAPGTVLFRDNGVTIGSAPVASGTAILLVPAVATGIHSFTASFSGSAMYAASQSPSLTVIPRSLVPYFRTTFNELASGKALNKSTPAINNVGGVWSDPNGDWTFRSGGGILSSTSDLANPVLLDTRNADYTATYVLPNYGLNMLFRYTDLRNKLFVVTWKGEVDLYATINGVDTTLATLYPLPPRHRLHLRLRPNRQHHLRRPDRDSPHPRRPPRHHPARLPPDLRQIHHHQPRRLSLIRPGVMIGPEPLAQA